jgi:hypothetical protein
MSFNKHFIEIPDGRKVNGSEAILEGIMVDNVWNEKDSNPQIKKATSSGKEN